MPWIAELQLLFFDPMMTFLFIIFGIMLLSVLRGASRRVQARRKPVQELEHRDAHAQISKEKFEEERHRLQRAS